MSKLAAVLAFIAFDILILVVMLPRVATTVDGSTVLIGILTSIIISLFIISKPYIGIIVTIVALPIQGLFPDTPIGTSILTIVGLVTLTSYLLHNQITNKSKFALTPIYIWSIAFALWLFISSPQSLFQGRNWIFTYIQLIILMWMSANLLNPRRQRRLMGLYLLVCILSAIVGITQGQLTSTISTTVRAEGFTENANEFAMYLVFAICFLVYFVASAKAALVTQIILLSSLVVLILGVVFSASRTGAISLAVVLLFAFLLYPKLASAKAQTNQITRGINLIMILFVLWVAATAVIPSEYWNILGEAQGLVQLGTQATKGTLAERLDFWQEGIQLWERSPILGIGAGQAVLNIGHVIHNMYLTVLVEQGIVGFILYMLWLGSVFYNLLRASFTSHDAEHVALATCWLLVLSAIMVFGVTNSFQYLKFPWLVAGISLMLLERRTNPDNVKIAPMVIRSIERAI